MVAESQSSLTSLTTVPPRSILIIDHGLAFGGTVVVAASLMRHLDATRYRAVLATAVADEFAATRVGLPDSVVMIRPSYSYQHAATLRQYVNRLPGSTVRKLANYVLSGIGSALNIGYAFRLLFLTWRINARVIHCNNGSNTEGALISWLTGIPCVYHMHGIGHSSRLKRFLRRRIHPRYVAISKVVAEHAYRSGVPRDRVSLLYNPVEAPGVAAASRGAFRRALSIPEDATLVGIVGRVVRWKGHREFLLAAMAAFRQSPALHAVVVGDFADGEAAYAESLTLMVRSAGFSDRVHFAGFVADTDAMYVDLDILVHASIKPEPFGLVITEAMVHGVPVIVANTGAPPEFIRHGLTGFIVDPTDTELLCAQIAALATDAALRRGIGDRGRRDALERFDAGNYALAFQDLYDQEVTRK